MKTAKIRSKTKKMLKSIKINKKQILRITKNQAKIIFRHKKVNKIKKN